MSGSEAENGPAEQEMVRGTARYLNRELSLLAFQRRVLEEARNRRHPLLERVKFLAILGNNLDEFVMVRLAGLKHQVEASVLEKTSDGLPAAEQLRLAWAKTQRLLTEAHETLQALLPELSAAGIDLCSIDELSDEEREAARGIFEERIFPVLTPLAIDPSHPFPHISSRSLNLAVVILDPSGEERHARVKIPESMPRFVALPGDGERQRFVWLEDLVAANLDELFPGLEVVESHPFRVVRDADLDIQEDEAADLLQTIEQSVRRRFFGEVVSLTVGSRMPEGLRALLVENLEVAPDDVWELGDRLGLHGLMEIALLDRRDLRDPPFVPATPPALAGAEDIFTVIRRGDVLLHHPYESFDPVVAFLEQAAADPQVLAIKQTLYRVGRNSPIVEALMRAREEGKQVAVLVELKARFDEERNIEWARALEEAGVHVVYGIIGLKTHAKVALVVRSESGGLRRYVHLGTGNYNPGTAHVYTDIGLLTCDPAIGADASDLFNYLTGYSAQRDFRRLLVAPVMLCERFLSMIAREIAHVHSGGTGHLIAKTNALVDPAVIEALYEASRAGVRIDLIVRGVCCLRPGVPGMSENIRVVSLVGRFLEHSRIYWFRNGGDEELYLGSADLMRRNLERRVEVLFPVQTAAHRAYLRDEVLGGALRDTVNARVLQPDGSWIRRRGAPFDLQATLLERHRVQRPALPWRGTEAVH